MGFLTGESMKAIRKNTGDVVTVFIPSSPTPFTGYTITVPRAEAMELPISIEEAIRFTVSGGVLVPGHQQATSGSGPGARERLPDGLVPLPGSPNEKEQESGEP